MDGWPLATVGVVNRWKCGVRVLKYYGHWSKGKKKTGLRKAYPHLQCSMGDVGGIQTVDEAELQLLLSGSLRKGSSPLDLKTGCVVTLTFGWPAQITIYDAQSRLTKCQ